MSNSVVTPHSAFELKRSVFIENLNITLEEYVHHSTKARHFHLANNDNNNAFLVAFLTVPQDSTGVAHILEHTVLCGSKRYPVRDPFFMMIRRSLNTFMNAFTASDWTAYPFATQNEKDFYNLLDVYLDAAFFPNLALLDFAQEGHRVEFEVTEDASTPLVFKGVVFNEMKGAMSSPTSVLYQELTKNLFPTVTYHHNSGGDPVCIPDLTHAELCAFHAKHYHPSNSVFMTYGNLPAAQHQAFFHEKVLQHFAYQPANWQVPNEKRYTAPVYVKAAYALPKEEKIEQKTHVVNAWLLNAITDPVESMRAKILSAVLLDNSSSPLLHALETSELGLAPSPFCGLEDSTKELFFMCGLEGAESHNAAPIEQLVMDTLQRVHDEGVAEEQVEAVLHQLELSAKEITGDRYPYGLKLMLDGLSPILHGGDPLSAWDLEQSLSQIRQEVKNKSFIPQLIQRLLLNNPHRVQLILAPDQSLADTLKAKEIARLQEMKAALNDTASAEIIAAAKALKDRQASVDDPEILPKVTIQDVPVEVPFPTPTYEKPALTAYTPATNGMVYQHIILNLPLLNAEELSLLPLLDALITEVGCGEASYLVRQSRMAAYTGGIFSEIIIRGNYSEPETLQGYLMLSGKALRRNATVLMDLLAELLEGVRFDEHQRLKEIVSQWRLGKEEGIVGSGHTYAMGVASQSNSTLSVIAQELGGMKAIQRLRTWDDALQNSDNMMQIVQKLQALYRKLMAASPEGLVISDASEQAHLISVMQQRLKLSAASSTSRFHSSFQQDNCLIKEGWAINAQVHYCAKSYATVHTSHADAPALQVLAGFLRNGFLHRAIREQGGAYGGGASYTGGTGSFNFYSYRDPRLQETLADFDRAIDWIMSLKADKYALEEAILGVIATIDKPGSPAGECRQHYLNQRVGLTNQIWQDYRQRILAVEFSDLQRVTEKYLLPSQGHIGVLGPKSALVEAGLSLKTIS